MSVKYIFFEAGLNFKILYLKMLRLGALLISESNLFNSIVADGIKVFLRKLYLTLK